MGDLITLSLLGLVSNVLIPFLNTPVPFIVFLLVAGSTVVFLYFTRRNRDVRNLLLQGWSPLFGAMAISCGTGIVLDLFVSKYEGFALLAVVISGNPSHVASGLSNLHLLGLPGAVGSVYISRLSTSLHAAALKRSSFTEPMLDGQNDSSDVKADPPGHSPRLAMITLLLVTLPIEIIFLSVLRALGWLHASFIFMGLSVLLFCCAVRRLILQRVDLLIMNPGLCISFYRPLAH